jgi:hypothetical protein
MLSLRSLFKKELEKMEIHEDYVNEILEKYFHRII